MARPHLGCAEGFCLCPPSQKTTVGSQSTERDRSEIRWIIVYLRFDNSTSSVVWFILRQCHFLVQVYIFECSIFSLFWSLLPIPVLCFSGFSHQSNSVKSILCISFCPVNLQSKLFSLTCCCEWWLKFICFTGQDYVICMRTPD